MPGVRSLPAAVLLAALAALLSAPSARAQAPGPPLPPDHWSYELLEALDVAGASSSWIYDVRPTGTGTVRAELDRIAEHDFQGAGDLARAWSRRLGAPNGETSWAATAEAGYRDGEGFLDPGEGAYGVLSAAADLGGGATLWGEGRVGGWSTFDGVENAGLSVAAGPFVLTGGRQRLKAAGSAGASSQLGSHVPLDALHAVSRRRAPLPGLDWLFGPVAWQFSLSPWNEVGDWEGGWLGVGGAVAQPHPRFRIGAVRSVRFARGDAEPATVERVLRSVFLLQNEPLSWDNQKLEIWLRYRWELFGQPLATYAVFAQEDSPVYLDPGILAGTKAARLLDSGLWQLSYEYRAYGARGQWCFWCEKTRDGKTESGRDQGPWYVHYGVRRYERGGFPMGDATGGYGAQHRIALAFWSRGGGFRGKATAFFQVRDDERNVLFDRWPGKRRGVRLEGGVPLGGTLEAVAEGLWADGPRIDTEWGLRLGLRAMLGGGR